MPSSPRPACPGLRSDSSSGKTVVLDSGMAMQQFVTIEWRAKTQGGHCRCRTHGRVVRERRCGDGRPSKERAASGSQNRTARAGSARERQRRPEGRAPWMARVIEPAVRFRASHRPAMDALHNERRAFGGQGRTARAGSARERQRRPEGRAPWMARVIEPAVRFRASHRPAMDALHNERRAFGGQGRNRTGVRGFAVRCMTTLPPGR